MSDVVCCSHDYKFAFSQSENITKKVTCKNITLVYQFLYQLEAELLMINDGSELIQDCVHKITLFLGHNIQCIVQ